MSPAIIRYHQIKIDPSWEVFSISTAGGSYPGMVMSTCGTFLGVCTGSLANGAALLGCLVATQSWSLTVTLFAAWGVHLVLLNHNHWLWPQPRVSLEYVFYNLPTCVWRHSSCSTLFARGLKYLSMQSMSVFMQIHWETGQPKALHLILGLHPRVGSRCQNSKLFQRIKGSELVTILLYAEIPRLRAIYRINSLFWLMVAKGESIMLRKNGSRWLGRKPRDWISIHTQKQGQWTGSGVRPGALKACVSWQASSKKVAPSLQMVPPARDYVLKWGTFLIQPTTDREENKPGSWGADRRKVGWPLSGGEENEWNKKNQRKPWPKGSLQLKLAACTRMTQGEKCQP